MSKYYRKQTMAFGICPTFEIQYLIEHFSSELRFFELVLSVLV